ncbi:MAG: hypothetical protein OHK006_00830 [Thermodesulfovibrionales bacterium]
MGIFSKLFGGSEPELPMLDAGSDAAKQFEKFKPQVQALVQKINDRYEAVPSDKAVYVFLGNPPGMFGIVWFLAGESEEHNLKKLMAKKGLSQRKIDNLMQKVKEAYSAEAGTSRYMTEVGGKKVIVIPSFGFADRLYSILHMMDE